MRIGVLGGSFNPPTKAHIELSNKCVEMGLCDKVIWVPVNDAYKKSTNVPQKIRADMVEIALRDEKNIDYSLHEMEFDRIVRTHESLSILQSRYPDDELLFIAGADKICFKWMQKEDFIKEFGYILVNRGDIDCESVVDSSPVLYRYRDKIKYLEYSSNVSSTAVRNEMFIRKISEDVKPAVLAYMLNSGLFS